MCQSLEEKMKRVARTKELRIYEELFEGIKDHKIFQAIKNNLKTKLDKLKLKSENLIAGDLDIKEVSQFKE